MPVKHEGKRNIRKEETKQSIKLMYFILEFKMLFRATAVEMSKEPVYLLSNTPTVSTVHGS
jgi:hypothetical protein